MKAALLKKGQIYKTPSYLGGVFTVKYIGEFKKPYYMVGRVKCIKPDWEIYRFTIQNRGYRKSIYLDSKEIESEIFEEART